MKNMTNCLALTVIFIFFALPCAASTLKIATISPEGSMWMEKMRSGAQIIKEQTRGRVDFKFYPGGVMGNDAAVLRKIHIGQLHGGAFVSGSLAKYFPGNQIYGQLMKFRSLDEVDFVREKMDGYIIDGHEKAGFSIVGLAGGGFAYLMSTTPVRTVEDLQNQKLWVPDDNSFTHEMVDVFGVSPIPLAISDVRTGLQTGLINTVANSPSGAIILQWHTQIKYVVDLPFLYLYACLAVDKKAFSRLDAADRQIVLDVMGRAFTEIQAQNRLDNIKAIEALKNQGVQFLSPSADEHHRWLTISAQSSDILIRNGLLPPDAVQMMNTLLQEYRNQNRSADGS